MSGNSTPLSQASTLVNWQEVKELTLNKSSETILPASAVLEYYSSKSSSAVFLYDVAREAGFGATLRELNKSEDGGHYAKVFELQSRTGAGLSLLGRLSEGTSSDGSQSSTALTAYTTPSGLALMAPTLALCPPPSTNGRLVIQVPSITHVGSDMSISPTLSQLTSLFTSSPEHFAVILSATPQEVVDFAAVSYAAPQSHIVHIFDHWSAARETSKKRAPILPFQAPTSDIRTALHKFGHSFFEYAGDANATNVVLVLNGPLALSIKHLASVIPSFGVVIVKVLRPWDENALRKVIPPSTTSLHVIDDVISSKSFAPLYHDALGLLAHALPKTPQILSHKLDTLTLGQLLTSGQSLVGYLSSVISLDWFAPPKIPTLEGKKVTFYSSPSSPLHEVPSTTSQLFLNHPSIDSHYVQNFDAFSKPSGVIQSTLLLNAAPTTTYNPPVLFQRGQGPETDALVILDPSLLKSHDILSDLKEGAPVLITTSWTVEELVANMSILNLETAILKKPQVLIIDIEKVASNLNASESAIAITTTAFLRLYLGSIATPDLITNLSVPFFGKEVSGVETRQISKASWDALSSVSLPTEVPAEEKITPLKQFQFNSILLEAPTPPKAITAQSNAWTEAAKQIVFKEAFSPALPQVKGAQYPRNPALRPDVVEDTYLVTCTVNRRLTPLEYNRNVFHLEFDTRGTGLKYEIGEALGVHGWNDADEVLHFCSWYGLNPKDVISIPLPGDPSKRHVRTIFQAFQQQIDIFGKPPKSFYEALSGFATAREDRLALRFISAAEGSSTFKKLSELETVTFADVLEKFPSARPPVETLCEIVGDIKPRHYSIASAQSAVGDRVDLLVVTVDWLTPSGSPRYGQCTRYLAGLKIGQKVTVSIKPSVMKLPPSNMQPIIMAGLGTGAAPFRAFMQHRALLASKNIPVGPMLYYFGSRHRSEEYLYGEEIEAYLQTGVITHAGLAFSRDEKRKVYIQHKMLQDGKMLADMLGEKQNQKGVFYLCGPTWPVPDVFEAIVGALGEYEGMERSIAEQYIEDLKEEERYVLEVY